jgi:hypothetical protein
MKCDKSDAKKHTEPFKLRRVESDGLRVRRCEGCGKTIYTRKKAREEKPKAMDTQTLKWRVDCNTKGAA